MMADNAGRVAKAAVAKEEDQVEEESKGGGGGGEEEEDDEGAAGGLARPKSSKAMSAFLGQRNKLRYVAGKASKRDDSYFNLNVDHGAVDSSVGAKRVLHEVKGATMERTGMFINAEDGLQIPW